MGRTYVPSKFAKERVARLAADIVELQRLTDLYLEQLAYEESEKQESWERWCGEFDRELADTIVRFSSSDGAR